MQIMLLGCSFLVSHVAYAEQPVLPRLAWDAPSACPSRAAVSRTLSHWLSQAPEAVDASALTVRARIAGSSGAWRLSLELTTPTGRAHDELRAASCSTLVDVIALKVALAAASAAALQSLPVEPAAQTASPPQFSLRLTAGATLGVVPQLSAALGLSGALQFGSARLELGLTLVAPQSARYAEPSLAGAGAEIGLLAGQLRGCVMTRLDTVEVPICAGVELGVMRGVGVGLPERFYSDQPFGQLLAGPGLRWSLARGLYVGFEIAAAVAFARPSYHVRFLERLFRPDPTSVRGLAGVEFEF